MMDELKLLVGMVADLPSMALWVIAFFFAYKVSIIGSIYGVIRLAIQRLYEWGISDARKVKIIRQEIHLEDLIHGITISSDDTKHLLIGQLKRVAGKNVGIGSNYIHQCSVDWLREAITMKEEADKKVAFKD
jgi:hypothetical protein